MNLREAWAVSLLASHQWSPEIERAIDRVAAGGFCKPLGLSLWHARYQNDAKALRDSLRVLERIVARRHPDVEREIRVAMARQVMHEYLFEFCPVCLGVGEVNTAKLRVVCHACGGSKVRQYTDRDRAHAMNITTSRLKSLSRAMRDLADYVEKMDRQTNATMVVQLRTDGY